MANIWVLPLNLHPPVMYSELSTSYFSVTMFFSLLQVGDINLWNLHNFNEKLFSAKTKQFHRTHLTTFDRLWSNLPYLRPIATITKDSLNHYGIDEYGGSVHDVIGTRCDQYSQKLITGTLGTNSCHQNLTAAIKPWNLQEHDVHDVFNIFMLTGFTRDTNEYFCRGSPATKGDYIEFFAEIDLLVGLSACPYGDVSIPVGEIVPDEKCFPLDVYIGQPSESLLNEWKKQKEL